MASESVQDDLLGDIVEDKRRRLWTATAVILPGEPIEVRLIGGPAKTLAIARKLVPWMRDNEEQVRQYAGDQLLDLHNAACNEGAPLTKETFVGRLHLDSAAVFDRGVLCCYKDKLQEWEHIVSVVISADGTFIRAATAPTVFRPEAKIHVEPFPPLALAIGFWTGKVVLESWRGFSRRLGAYGSLSSAKPSDGTAPLSIKAPGKDKNDPPSKEQAIAYRYLLDHDEAIHQAILERIVAAYPDIRDKYGRHVDAADLPDVKRPADLEKLIGVSTVHVLRMADRGAAYVGFEFGCTWDIEHGLGIMTHKDRVLAMGGADTSFLEWIAERDAKAPQSLGG
jgi:hypothetical protein